MSDLEDLFEHAPEGAVAIKMDMSNHLHWVDGKNVYWDTGGNGWANCSHHTSWKTIATRPQPESKPQPKFKVGDTVKRINGAHCGMRVEDCATVAYLNGHDEVNLKEFGGIHSAEMLELVKQQEPRSTVEDAVEAFPDGFSTRYKKLGIGDWLAVCVKDSDDGGIKGEYVDVVKEHYKEEYYDLICPLKEFEACVAAKTAKSEPEWTHVTNSGYSCKIVVGEPDWGGHICVMREDIGYDVLRPNDLEPIKPTITKAEKEKCAAMANYFNINPAEFDEYMSKYDVVEQLRKEQEK
jgi:hypothetical protein